MAYQQSADNTAFLYAIGNETNVTVTEATGPPPPSEGCMDSALGLVRVITNIYLILPIAVFGIIANVLAFIVLEKQYRKQSTTTYLQSLAIADTFILVSTVLVNSFRYMYLCFDVMGGYQKIDQYIVVVLFPLLYVFRLAGVWLTVSLTMDRWIAVCDPLSAQSKCTRSRSCKQVALIFAVSLIYSIPRFFEYSLDETNPHGFSSNPMYNNKIYTLVYKIILFFLIMYLIPMIIMSVLNLQLIKALRRAFTSGKEMASDRLTNKKRQKDQQAVTAVVVSVVVLFIVCHLLALITQFLWAFEFYFESLKEPRRYIAHISNVMVTINSASNFLIYCACSQSFRDRFKQLFCGKCIKPKMHSWRSSMATEKSSVTMTTTHL